MFSLNKSFSLSNENSDINEIIKGDEMNLEDMKNFFQNSFLNQNNYFYKENDFIKSFYSLNEKSIHIEKDNSFLNKKRLIENRKQRGRIPFLTRNKRKHNSISFDNLLLKIQVHFFSFIIDISNDALDTYFGRDNIFNFKEISYKKKN